MDTSLFLAQWWGVLLLVMGASILVRREGVMKVMKEFASSNPSPGYFVGLIEFTLGLTLVLLHNEWSFGWQGVVTILGWLVFLEGATYLFAPISFFTSVMKKVNNSNTYLVGGVISLVLGAWLAGIGFGLI